MSSDILARVEALDVKAKALAAKGHLLRAADNFGLAAEAARALGADNVVMLDMQLEQGNLLSIHAGIAPNGTADSRHGLLAHRVALLSGAVEALERRRVAGTLMEGKCAAAEEAFCRVRHEGRQCVAGVPAADAAGLAALVGYDVFIRAAIDASKVLANARWYAASCSGVQFQSFAQHVVHAAELMQQPLRHGGMNWASEAMFTSDLRKTVGKASANGLHERLVQLLAAALQQLERSGVVEARGIDNTIKIMKPAEQVFEATVQNSLNASGLRSCALPGCGAKEAHPAHFKSCAACRAVVYCCREHQVEAWPAHKKACKAARKAAAAADEDGAGPSGA